MPDENQSPPGDICPHLGSIHDVEIRYQFANPIHICQQTKPNGQIFFEHQVEFCVTKNHINCHLYAGPSSKPLPDFIHPKDTSRTQKKRSKWIWLSIALFILIAGGVGLGIYLAGNETQTGRIFEIMAVSPTPTEIPPDPTRTSTPHPTQTTTTSPTQTLRPTTQPSETPEPTNTEIVPPTPGPNLGTPFGNYLLHRVKTGESLTAIANIYQVSSENITAINVLPEGRGIWAGDILIIPIGSETDDNIRFQYIFIEKKTDLATLVETYSVAIDQLREYNLLGPLDWVPAGRWLIIPVVGE